MLVVSAPSVAREKPPREEDSIVQLVSELPSLSLSSLLGELYHESCHSLPQITGFESDVLGLRWRPERPVVVGIALFGRPLLTCSLPAPSRGVTRAGKAPEARSSCRQYYTPSAGTAARSAPQGLARTPRVLLPVPAVP